MFSPAPYILAAWILIYLPHVVAAVLRSRLEGGYDNRHPRAQQARLTGLGARAMGAHNNGFEAFPAFAAAAILCSIQSADPRTASTLSVVFVAARVLYVVFYLANLPTLRSTAWAVAVLATLGLFVLAVRTP